MKSQVSSYPLIIKTSYIIWQNMENNICNRISIYECVAAKKLSRGFMVSFRICLINSYFCDPAPFS